MEPDLFSVEINDSQEAKETPVFPERSVLPAQQTESGPGPEKQPEIKQSELNTNNLATDARQPAGDEKKIEKILLIYSDRTFIELKPGN